MAFRSLGLQASLRVTARYNNATISLAENMLGQIETALGGKPLVFDNAPAAAA